MPLKDRLINLHSQNAANYEKETALQALITSAETPMMLGELAIVLDNTDDANPKAKIYTPIELTGGTFQLIEFLDQYGVQELATNIAQTEIKEYEFTIDTGATGTGNTLSDYIIRLEKGKLDRINAGNGIAVTEPAGEGFTGTPVSQTVSVVIAENPYIEVDETGIKLSDATGSTASTATTALEEMVDDKIHEALYGDGSGSTGSIQDQLDELDQKIEENKVTTPEDGAIQVTPGSTDESGTTTPTTIELVINPANPILSKDKSGLTATLNLVALKTPTEGYLKSYQLQGIGNAPIGATIDIPKDFLIKAAEIKTCEVADKPVSGMAIGDKYIDFTVNVRQDTDDAETDEHLYIPIKDMFDEYLEGNGIDITDDNKISVKIVEGDKYLVVDETGVHIAPVTGDTSATTATNLIDQSIEEAVEAAKEELQEQIDANRAAGVVAVTAATTDPISALTASAETGNTVTLSLKIATDAEVQAVPEMADFGTRAGNRIQLTADGKLFVSNIIDGGTF